MKVTVDILCLCPREKPTKIALIQRACPPFKGQWALPGGFLESDEALEEAARRELREETGLMAKELKQFYCFDELDRDPRGRAISIAYLALFDTEEPGKAQDDAAAFAWFSLFDLPALAFDHRQIIAKGLEMLEILKP